MPLASVLRSCPRKSWHSLPQMRGSIQCTNPRNTVAYPDQPRGSAVQGGVCRTSDLRHQKRGAALNKEGVCVCVLYTRDDVDTPLSVWHTSQADGTAAAGRGVQNPSWRDSAQSPRTETCGVQVTESKLLCLFLPILFCVVIGRELCD